MKNAGIVSFGVAMATIVGQTQAESSGVWTNQDWFDETEGVGVKNGVPYGLDPEAQRRVDSAMLQSGPGLENEDKENVRRIMDVFREHDWNFLFPMADRLYTYDSFIVAAGLYPKFCNEDDPSLGLTADDVCRRELATLFAHIIFETNADEPSQGHEYFKQGLHHVKDHHCGKYPKFPPFDGPPECDFHSTGWSGKMWPAQEHAQYYPRGPLMMKWNYNYGRLADALYPGYPRDKQNIMKNPENLESGILGFLSSLWIYMTPRSPQPSMHEIATGFYKPNQHDELSQIFPAFGATTNIFNGNKECNVEFGSESDQAYHRAQIYLDMLNFFNLHPEYHLGCSKMGPFPDEGAAAHSQYFTKGVKANTCDLVRFPTGYSLYNRNDYKRCVCDSWMMEAEDCIRGDDDQKIPTETQGDSQATGADTKGGEGKPTEVGASPTGSRGDQAETTDGQQTTQDKQRAYGQQQTPFNETASAEDQIADPSQLAESASIGETLGQVGSGALANFSASVATLATVFASLYF